MTHRRHSPRQRFAAVLLVVLLARLTLTMLDLVCRALVYLLTHVCHGLEWAIRGLTIGEATRPTPAASIQPRRVTATDSGRTPVPPVRRQPAAELSEVDKFMRVLGTRDRAFAETLLASGTRVQA